MIGLTIILMKQAGRNTYIIFYSKQRYLKSALCKLAFILHPTRLTFQKRLRWFLLLAKANTLVYKICKVLLQLLQKHCSRFTSWMGVVLSRDAWCDKTPHAQVAWARAPTEARDLEKSWSYWSFENSYFSLSSTVIQNYVGDPAREHPRDVGTSR